MKYRKFLHDDEKLTFKHLFSRWLYGFLDCLPENIRTEKKTDYQLQLLRDYIGYLRKEGSIKIYENEEENQQFAYGKEVKEFERVAFGHSPCQILDDELGFLAGIDSKYSTEKTAEILSNIQKREMTRNDILMLGDTGKLKVHKVEKDQRTDRGTYNREFVISTRRDRSERDFTDYLAWVTYSDLCEFVIINSPVKATNLKTEIPKASENEVSENVILLGDTKLQEKYIINEMERRCLDFQQVPKGEKASLQRYFLAKYGLSASVFNDRWKNLDVESVHKTIS